jgi:hypothetical protein
MLLAESKGWNSTIISILFEPMTLFSNLISLWPGGKSGLITGGGNFAFRTWKYFIMLPLLHLSFSFSLWNLEPCCAICDLL